MGKRSTGVVRRELETGADAATPTVQIARIVADLEDTDPTALAPVWERTDEVLECLFANPPEQTAQMTVSFTYGQYRIDAAQDGTVELRRVGPT